MIASHTPLLVIPYTFLARHSTFVIRHSSFVIRLEAVKHFSGAGHDENTLAFTATPVLYPDTGRIQISKIDATT